MSDEGEGGPEAGASADVSEPSLTLVLGGRDDPEAESFALGEPPRVRLRGPLPSYSRGELRERLRQADAILADEHADLRAFSADLDSDVDAWLARSRDLRARKLAFFESLSDSEKANVRNVMRERLARLARLRSAFTTLVQDLD